MRKRVYALGLVGCLATSAFQEAAGEDFLRPFDALTVGYSTFQSHVDRHAIVGRYLFFTYTLSEAKDYSAENWRLIQYDLADNSRKVLHQGSHATRAPCVQRDGNGDIYLLHPDTLKAGIRFYRFEKNREYGLVKEAAYYVVPGPGYKFSCAADPSKNTFLFIGNSGRLVTFDREGAVLSDQAVVQKRDNISLQYPHIVVGPTGRIHLAWTASDDNHNWWYTFIGYMYSDQAGLWNISKQVVSRVPVFPDDEGAVLAIAKQESADRPINRFLGSMLPVQDRVHFAFSRMDSIDDYRMVFSDPSSNHQQHTAYISGSSSPAVKEAPFSDRETIANGVDGTLSSDAKGRLYYVTSSAGRLLVLFASYDEGTSWHVIRKLAIPDGFYPYAIGSVRHPDDDGRLLGTLTLVSNFSDMTAPAQTWIFSISTLSDACARWAGAAVKLHRPFTRVADKAFVMPLLGKDQMADSAEIPNRSPFLLCEDKQLIGRPHSLHEEISRLGGGRYSHWVNSIYFSSSDGSDPNTNGREYMLVRPPGRE